jgi:DNA-binding transcriptional regulator YiaG
MGVTVEMPTIAEFLALREELLRKPPELRRAIRRAAHVSLDQVGRDCGVSAETARLWESGKWMPRKRRHLRAYVEVLRQLAEAS